MKNYVATIAVIALTFSGAIAQPGELVVAKAKTAYFNIVLPAVTTRSDSKAASVLQLYMQRISGARPDIFPENEFAHNKGKAIYIGNTNKAKQAGIRKSGDDAFLVRALDSNIYVVSGGGKGTLYAIYAVLEGYWGCRKYSAEEALVPQKDLLTLPGNILIDEKPAFEYREVYGPDAMDEEYRNWHRLQQFEELWGLWGHTFNKLVPAKTYFKTHPEYYSLAGNRRIPAQLCLSEPRVLNIVIDELKKRMSDNPDAIYWSVSPNDDIGYCQCDQCKSIDATEGGPQGSLIRFVNRVAAKFPDKKIVTLAYGYTSHPTLHLKPASNVVVMLSTINAFRDKPLQEEGSAGSFRNDLEGWSRLTNHLFVWDYTAQFTNYLAPFPVQQTLQPNIAFFYSKNIKGIFSQGSDYAWSDMTELKTYTLSRLLWDPGADAKIISDEFLKGYYGGAGKFVSQYAEMLQQQVRQSGRKLDIYGNPVNEWNSYLTPALIDQYSSLLDKAEAAVEHDATLLKHVRKARLPLEYTVLQQSKFYGIEKHGCFIPDGRGGYKIADKFPMRVQRFKMNATNSGVTQLSEGGLSPEQYLAEWQTIFKTILPANKATGAMVSLRFPFAPEYPAKGPATLVDGVPGYDDFSYNWLCFYGVPLEATIDLGKPTDISSVMVHFLDDPRHWIFLPAAMQVECSLNGTDYEVVFRKENTGNEKEEHFDRTIRQFECPFSLRTARYVRFSATNIPGVPEWRTYATGKKPMIACDEILIK